MRVAMAAHVEATVERVGMVLPERPPSDVRDNG
jgi:hypothetical protein